jgi:hypothetical protein
MIKTILNGSISTRAAADNLKLGQLLKYRMGPARHDLSRHRSIALMKRIFLQSSEAVLEQSAPLETCHGTISRDAANQ